MATIRRPTPDEAPILTDMAIAAKGFWGYSPEFMAAARDELTITAAEIAQHEIHVAVVPGAAAAAEEIAGVYRITATPDAEGFDAELSYLWIDPRRIRTGLGSLLWADAMRRAAGLGYRVLSLDADPHAEGFYLKKGAEKYGEVPSKSIPGRMLPLIRVDVDKAVAAAAQ